MRRIGAASIIVVVLACFVAACANLFSPAKKILCPGSLYCGSYIVPQTVSGGTCCTVVDIGGGGAVLRPNASVGYLCAYGSDKVPAGCMASLEQARYICPSAPGVVRCTTE